ncbi:hypothetical protein F4804DRAFT_344325 [Jackrogersella minutella]|nr:hypothetical protein F4804DRAFT_344325 [Jackrogersella minutella]
MSSIASTELFKMRIPSPDPELSGEALSKEVPDDPSRKGTIYADQFLAHKCPSGFDDLQRRQFFCILDLRRLKYAANEIFAKKDWKLNIMNFAKEYEKSRGLIMLRYGLYEFKNVKPSEEVLKRWRATHNLPEPEPQAETAAAGDSTPSHRRPLPASTTSTKRKAEEDITPKDNALMTSTANQNKRRHVTLEQANPALTGPAPFKKSKRKADETDEPDENQPSKVQKSTPSAAKSKFESILNRTQSGNTSPLKRAPLASFGTPKPSEFQNSSLAAKSNPAKSTPAKSTSNIFSYLSESSANSSSNDNGNADEADTESESEEEAGSQEVPPSDQPSATGSAGTNTPSTQSDSTPFSSDKPSSFSLFGQPNKGLSTKANADSKDDSASKGGLFGRVQMGSNGQPLRATTDAEEESDQATPAEKKPATTATSSFFLQAGSDAFTGASKSILDEQNPQDLTNTPSDSPFPAPSSIGTTPISGTPEPQTQNEGGEEASHEQISLTEGGPGEEDEIILHEVRAKAIKFVPVSKGGDEEDEKKSPWSTQGVGPLRVLKNKSTGTVRMLLRAEPRGHIALNKALISDLEYSAKEKTVNFAAASDNGLDLETWVLQVKKPESAQQLVNVLEANKGANKK